MESITYEGTPCGVCGCTSRYRSGGRCVDCAKESVKKRRIKNAVGKKKRQANKFCHIDCPDGVDYQCWNDWLVVRKFKSSPLTHTAFNMFVRECEAAHISINDGVKLCAERNWASLKRGWEAVLEIAKQNASGDYNSFEF